MNNLLRRIATPVGEELAEEIAAEIHEVYRNVAREAGWQMRPSVDVPYKKMNEQGKDLDRGLARWHLARLRAVEAERDRLVQIIEERGHKFQTAIDAAQAEIRRLTEVRKSNARS